MSKIVSEQNTFPKIEDVQKRFNQLMGFLEKFNAHNPPMRNFVWANMKHWHYQICLATEPVTLEEMVIIEKRVPSNVIKSVGFQTLLGVMVGIKTFHICEDCSYPLIYHDHKKDGCPNCGDTFPESNRRKIVLK